MVGWHHQFNGHEFEQAPGIGDEQGSLVCCSPWGGRVGHDWVTELNWHNSKSWSIQFKWVIPLNFRDKTNAQMTHQHITMLLAAGFEVQNQSDVMRFHWGNQGQGLTVRDCRVWSGYSHLINTRQVSADFKLLFGETAWVGWALLLCQFCLVLRDLYLWYEDQNAVCGHGIVYFTLGKTDQFW